MPLTLLLFLLASPPCSQIFPCLTLSSSAPRLSQVLAYFVTKKRRPKHREQEETQNVCITNKHLRDARDSQNPDGRNPVKIMIIQDGKCEPKKSSLFLRKEPLLTLLFACDKICSDEVLTTKEIVDVCWFSNIDGTTTRTGVLGTQATHADGKPRHNL